MTKIVIAVWFLLAFLLSVSGWFERFSSAALFGIGALLSSTGFVILHRYHTGFRSFARAADLRHLTEGQALRFYGLLAFVETRGHVLPAIFAIPTGTIDVMVAATAFYAAAHFVSGSRKPGKGFFLWHLAGIVGLGVSVALAILTATPRFGLVGPNHTSQAMAQFPMSLVPTFVGPLTLVLHLLALTEGREEIRRT